MSGISHSPLLRAIVAHAADCPDKTALIDCDGNIVSYSALRDNIKRAASLLYSKGIGHGDRIILSAQKEPEFVYFYLASHMLGMVNVV